MWKKTSYKAVYNKTTLCINIFMVLYKLSRILIYEQVFLQGHIILYNKVASSESNIKDMELFIL